MKNWKIPERFQMLWKLKTEGNDVLIIDHRSPDIALDSTINESKDTSYFNNRRLNSKQIA